MHLSATILIFGIILPKKDPSLHCVVCLRGAWFGIDASHTTVCVSNGSHCFFNRSLLGYQGSRMALSKRSHNIGVKGRHSVVLGSSKTHVRLLHSLLPVSRIMFPVLSTCTVALPRLFVCATPGKYVIFVRHDLRRWREGEGVENMWFSWTHSLVDSGGLVLPVFSYVKYFLFDKRWKTRLTGCELNC